MSSPRYVDSINAALRDLLADERTFLLGEDICDPYGGAFKATRGLSTDFPDRVLNMPISEAGFTGIAIGMAMRGLRPIVEIMFSDFLTLIADQLVNGAAKFEYMYNGQVKVPLVIRTPSGGRRGYGPTHSQSLETMFFHIPGISIVAPSLWHDPGACLKKAVEAECPTLFIEGKSLYPERLHGDSTETVYLGSESPKIAIIAYGNMASLAYEVCKNYENVQLVIPSEIGEPVISKAVRDCFFIDYPLTPIPSAPRLEQAALIQVDDIRAEIERCLK